MLSALHEAAHRGDVHRRSHARVGVGLGTRHARRSSSRTATRSSARASITTATSEINADGTFSLGYPRRDGGEEINARVCITRRPMADLRHAFELDDWPVEGSVSGEYHLYGNYETPFGVRPRSSIDRGRRVRRDVRHAPARRCASRAPASGSTTFEVQKSTGAHDRRRVGRMGRQLLIQRGRRAAFRSNRWRPLEFPTRAALRCAAVHRHGNRHVRDAALRRARAHRRSVRRRRRHRPGDRPARACAASSLTTELRSRLAAARGVGRRDASR